MSRGNAAVPAPDEQSLEAELDVIRRRFGHLGHVDAKLGQGAMGGVYRVVREGQSFALKVLLPKTLSDDAAVKRFLLEGKLLAELDHRNILKVYEVGTCEDWPFMISELVDGGAADELVARGAIGWERALAICESVLEALAEVHKRKIYHRDIKPSNVLLTKGQVVKLADFGIAKAEGTDARKTTTGIILGTPAYIAPEVLKGRAADAKSDLYSVGVLLFELVAGRLPWDIDDPNGFLTVRLTQSEPPRLASFVPGVPRTIDALVQTAMNDNPVDRYPTAATFLKALRVTRDRLVSAVGSAASGTARLAAPAAPPVGSTQVLASPPPSPLRVTSTKLRRVPASVIAPEAPSRAGTYAAVLAAALGLATVVGIVATRKPPAGTPQTAVRMAAQVTLNAEEHQMVTVLATYLRGDPTGKSAAGPLAHVAALGPEGAARVLFSLYQLLPSSPPVQNALMATRSVLAVDCAARVMTDAALSENDRVGAANALLAITRDQPSPNHPGLAVDHLITYLTTLSGSERRELVAAAVQTLGWERDPTTSDDALSALVSAPSRTGWLGEGPGVPDPEAVIRTALERIDNAAAQRRLAELPKARAGKRDGSSLSPKTR